jgi:hypothetical protein
MRRFYSELFASKSPRSQKQNAEEESDNSLSVSFTRHLDTEMTKIVRRSRSFEQSAGGCQTGHQLDGKTIRQKYPTVGSLGRQSKKGGGLTSYFATEAVGKGFVNRMELEQPTLSPERMGDKCMQGKVNCQIKERTKDNLASEVIEAAPSPKLMCSPDEARPNPEGRCSSLIHKLTSPGPTQTTPGTPKVRQETPSPEVARDYAGGHKSLELSPIGYSELSGQHYLLRQSPEGECSLSTKGSSQLAHSEDKDRAGILSQVISCDVSSQVDLRHEDEEQRLEMTLMGHHSPVAPSQDSGFSDSGDSLSEKGGTLKRVSFSQRDSLSRSLSSKDGSLARSPVEKANYSPLVQVQVAPLGRRLESPAGVEFGSGCNVAGRRGLVLSAYFK